MRAIAEWHLEVAPCFLGCYLTGLLSRKWLIRLAREFIPLTLRLRPIPARRIDTLVSGSVLTQLIFLVAHLRQEPGVEVQRAWRMG